MRKEISLETHGIVNNKINYRLTAEVLQNIIIEKQQGRLTLLGALVVNTGEFTRHSPMDRFIFQPENPIEIFRIELISARSLKLNEYQNLESQFWALCLVAWIE